MSEIETDSQSKVVVSFRRRLILAGFLFFVALFLWLQTPEPRAANYIRVYGYFFTAAAFLGFAASVMPLIAGFVTRTISRREWLLAASVVALGAWLIFSHAAFDYKFVQSEYRNAAVAESLHVERTVEVLSGGRLIGDRFIRIYRESTTQAWMYPFLVSLTHDVLGYRESNLFIVNACLGIALLALGYAQGACLGGRQGGILALLLWVSLPLLSYSASGAGIELSQVVLLQAVFLLSFLYLKEPNAGNETRLCLGMVLLAYCQVEALFFVIPVACVIVVGWIRIKRCLFSWGLVFCAPLLLGALWLLTLQPEQQWSLTVFSQNAGHALYFFFCPWNDMGNSLLIAVPALPSLLGVVLLLRRQGTLLRANPDIQLALIFTAGVGCHLAVLLGYSGAQLNHLEISGLSLPLYAVMVLLTTSVTCRVVKNSNHWCYIHGGVIFAIFGFTVPMNVAGVYSEETNQVREQRWVESVSAVELDPGSLIIDEFTLPWVLRRWAAVTPAYATTRLAEWQANPPFKRYPDLYVVDRMFATSMKGSQISFDSSVDLEGVTLELVAERSFEPFTKTRISRIVWAQPDLGHSRAFDKN